MEKTVAMLSPQEFEHLLKQIIDRQMEVWFTQLLDTLSYTKIIHSALLQCCLRIGQNFNALRLASAQS